MKFVRQGLLLLALIAAVSFGIRSWHQADGGGRLICDPAQIPEGAICLDDVFKRFQGQVVWVDARTETEWEKNTIPGALCLNPSADPARWDELIASAMMPLMQAGVEGKPIVVFCQSEECGASKEVAEKLRDPEQYGIPGEIYVLHQGWQAIQRYPYAQLVD